MNNIGIRTSTRDRFIAKLLSLALRWLALTAALMGTLTGALTADDKPWKRHTIDNTSRGADGVRLGDINKDGRLDLVCGWEEGGVIRVYLCPTPGDETKPWPHVTVGNVRSPEDAVFVDLDKDGRLDVLSCTEGKSKMLYMHWAEWKKHDNDDILDETNWKTEPIPVSAGQAWMFAEPVEVDGRPGPEVFVGSKGGNATISLLHCPGENRRDLKAYQLNRLTRAGWIMSLKRWDFDQDGDLDLLATDRKGPARGIFWLENPNRTHGWKRHNIGGNDAEVMFLCYGKLQHPKRKEIVCATRNKKILIARPASALGSVHPWATLSEPNPLATPNGKAVEIADINQDGRNDIVHTCNNGGKRQYRGVVWMEQAEDGSWNKVHDISGKEGVKFDLIQMLDVDGDGDLDVMTCEERDNLGLIWYENPTRP